MANHHHHHQGHHHHHGDSCCSESECPCCTGEESCQLHKHHHPHEEGGFAQDLLDLADDAWMEVLREKIKDNIVKNHGKNLDKLAQLISESNSERWKFKLAKQKQRMDYLEKIAHFFSQGK
jgi:hypothetical protein